MNSQNQLRDNVITSTSRKRLSWREKKRSGLAARYISTVNQIAIHMRYYYIHWSTTWMRHTVTKRINTLSASSNNNSNSQFFKRLSSSWSQRSNSIWRCICRCIILDLSVAVLVSQPTERFKIGRSLSNAIARIKSTHTIYNNLFVSVFIISNWTNVPCSINSHLSI